MKPCIIGTVVWFSCWLCIMSLQAESPEIEAAREHGAKGKITFRIIDSKGKPVANANVNVAFSHSDSHVNDDVFDKPTDTNGLCMVSGISVDQMNFTITKPSHYKTEGQYWFLRQGENCVQDGRWHPWNPTNTVVLKECRNPVPMFAKHVDTTIPVQGVPIGFDLAKGDWVTPNGHGDRSDLIIRYTATYEGPQSFSKRIEMIFSNTCEGIQTLALDNTSELISMYDAPETDYNSKLVLERERTRTKIIKSQELGKDQYLVFRVRTVTDKDEKIISANYGKIYGPIDYGRMGDQHRLIFTYYFNPTSNSRNLEFDPGRNLIANPGKMRVYMP